MLCHAPPPPLCQVVCWQARFFRKCTHSLCCLGVVHRCGGLLVRMIISCRMIVSGSLARLAPRTFSAGPKASVLTSARLWARLRRCATTGLLLA